MEWRGSGSHLKWPLKVEENSFSSSSKRGNCANHSGYDKAMGDMWVIFAMSHSLS